MIRRHIRSSLTTSPSLMISKHLGRVVNTNIVNKQSVITTINYTSSEHSSSSSECCLFHTNFHQKIKYEQAVSEVSALSFSNLHSFLQMTSSMNHDNDKNSNNYNNNGISKNGNSTFVDLLRRIDFRKLSQEHGIEPRSTFHEYNSNGNLLRLSRKPDESVKLSAVMALFVEKCTEHETNVPYLILLQKTPAKKNTNYQHAGQVSFPGGVFDEKLDNNLLETAMRETFEEIGLKNVELLNQTLPSTTTGARNFNVQPFIGRILEEQQQQNKIPYHLQSDEIAHVFEVKLLDLISTNNICCTFEPLGRTVMSPTSTHYGPVYHLRNIHSITHDQVLPHVPLWGYTATVVTQILDGLNFELSNYLSKGY